MRRCLPQNISFAHFYPENKEKICQAADIVIPLRHPVAVAISWKKRGKTGFAYEWRRMCWASDPLFFPLETKPWRVLEVLTKDVDRRTEIATNLGEYPERLAWQQGDIDTVKDYLGEQWDVCQELLAFDPIARDYYG